MKMFFLLPLLMCLVFAPFENSFAAQSDLTAAQLHKEVAQLLADLDGFKDSAIFKQCGYGCGANNPGKVWNQKRAALQDAVTPALEANPMLKAAPAYLFQLGQAYFKNNSKDIKFFREQVMQGLDE